MRRCYDDQDMRIVRRYNVLPQTTSTDSCLLVVAQYKEFALIVLGSMAPVYEELGKLYKTSLYAEAPTRHTIIVARRYNSQATHGAAKNCQEGVLSA